METEFRKGAFDRPHLRKETSALRTHYEESKRDPSMESRLDLIRLWYELLHRKLWRGSRQTLAGALFDEIDDHFEALKKQGFRWPDIEAPGGDGSLEGGDWRDESPLSRMGYSVRSNGPTTSERQNILRAAFLERIPTKGQESAEWGAPKTGARLRKLANHIAAIARAAQRRAHPPKDAIKRWRDDLAWLKRNFYDGTVFSFSWPKA
jgi:hypothetical protein